MNKKTLSSCNYSTGTVNVVDTQEPIWLWACAEYIYGPVIKGSMELIDSPNLLSVLTYEVEVHFHAWSLSHLRLREEEPLR